MSEKKDFLGGAYIKYYSALFLATIVIPLSPEMFAKDGISTENGAWYMCHTGPSGTKDLTCGDHMLFKKVTDPTMISKLSQEYAEMDKNKIEVMLNVQKATSMQDLLLQLQAMEQIPEEMKNNPELLLKSIRIKENLEDKSASKTHINPREKVILSAINDKNFREKLITDPRAAASGIGVTLSDDDLLSLQKIDLKKLENMSAKDLDAGLTTMAAGSIKAGSIWITRPGTGREDM